MAATTPNAIKKATFIRMEEGVFLTTTISVSFLLFLSPSRIEMAI